MIEAKNTEQEGSNIKCGHFFCLACISGIESEMKQNELAKIMIFSSSIFVINFFNIIGKKLPE